MKSLKAFLAVLLFILVYTQSTAADKYITFQDLSGKVYSNVMVLKIEKDGVMLRYGVEFRYDRVKFTNLTEEAQLICGYDAKKIAQELAEKAANRKRATDAYIAERERKQDEEIRWLAALITIINGIDFPKADAEKSACREIAAELNGLNKAIELGLNYGKYSDLVTDTAIKIEKQKDLSKSNLSPVFLILADECLKSHTDAKKQWSESISTQSESTKEWREYGLQRYWAVAGIHYTLLYGIVEGKTNANNLAIQQAVRLVKSEKNAARSGALPFNFRKSSNLYYLSDEEILRRVKAKLNYDTESAEIK